MIYREAGQFKETYASDQAIFPILQDRVFVLGVVAAAFLVPLVANEYWLQAILIPFLIYALAALGLNLLTGYAGQLSLGTGGFMAVGAYSAFKLTTAFPQVSIIAVFLASGLIAAGVGILFGIPSLRIKGFYLAVATLAAQFFLVWLFNKVPWFVELRAVWDHHRPAPHRARRDGDGAGGDGRRPVPDRARHRGGVRPGRQEPRARARGPLVDGHPRPRHRRGDHRSAAAAHQAPGLRRQLVLLRRGRRGVSFSSISAAPRRRPSTSRCRSSCCSW